MTPGDDESVSLDAIENAPIEVPKSELKRARSERDLLAHEEQKFKNELGWLGKPFGGRSEKPGNISALVIVSCFIIMFYVYKNPPTDHHGVNFERIFGGLTSIVTLVLGYLFGSNDRNS